MKTRLLFLFVILSFQLFGQSTDSNKSIYLEFGGSAGFGSINYENVFAQRGNFGYIWRVGLSGFPIDRNNGFVFVIPVDIGMLIGERKHQLELGVGQGFSMTTRGSFFAMTTPIIGYRYRPRGKFYFRLSYTPLISYIVDLQYQHWGGISIGYHIN